MRGKVGKWIVAVGATALMSANAMALPVFQVYTPDATAYGDNGEDQDSWFTPENPFAVEVVSAITGNAEQLNQIKMIVSVPNGQTGSVTIRSYTLASDGSRVYGSTKQLIKQYTTQAALIADLPLDFDGKVNLNNHYPFTDSVSDFLVFDLGLSFKLPGLKSSVTSQLDPNAVEVSKTLLPNYNADGDHLIEIDPNDPVDFEWSQAFGAISYFELAYSGYAGVHLDVLGLATDANGKKEVRTSWEINPGSHDVTGNGPPAVPLPAAAWGGLALLGMLGAGRLRRRS